MPAETPNSAPVRASCVAVDPRALFDYARRYADRAEQTGRGTEFPTVRMAAKRFRCTQQAIVDAVEGGVWPSDDVEYFGLAVGIQAGGGYGVFDSVGDYEIEAYRE